MVFLYIYDISMQRYEIILILPQVLCFFVFSCVILCSCAPVGIRGHFSATARLKSRSRRFAELALLKVFLHALAARRNVSCGAGGIAGAPMREQFLFSLLTHGSSVSFFVFGFVVPKFCRTFAAASRAGAFGLLTNRA